MSLRIINFKNNKVRSVESLTDGRHTNNGKRRKTNGLALNINTADCTSYIDLDKVIIQCGNFDTCLDDGTDPSGDGVGYRNNNSYEIKFPKPFPNRCLAVVASTAQFNAGKTDENGPQLITVVQGWNATEFRVMGDSASNAMHQASGISWIAIGY